MVLNKIYLLDPTSVPDFLDKLKKTLYDKDPSVMAACLNLYYTHFIIFKEKTDIPKIKAIKELTTSFVVIIKQIIDHKLNRDYDYKRMPAPWMQIKLLQLLSLLGENDQKTSD
jgi:AP-4 complex subunit epsilon-1